MTAERMTHPERVLRDDPDDPGYDVWNPEEEDM